MSIVSDLFAAGLVVLAALGHLDTNFGRARGQVRIRYPLMIQEIKQLHLPQLWDFKIGHG